MVSLVRNISLISISVIFFFLILIFWIFLSSKIKDYKWKSVLTSFLVVFFFIIPVIIKILLTDGFLLSISDQTFAQLFIQKFVHHNQFVDPFIKNISPFYPPLFFFTTAKLGQIFFNGNILLVYNLGSLLFFTIVIVSVVFVIKEIVKDQVNTLKFPLFLVFIFLFFSFFDFEFLFGKSYEILSFVLMVLVIFEIEKKGMDFSVMKIGILLGLIALLYFYSLIVFIPALFFYVIYIKSWNRRLLKKAILTVLVSFMASSPYSFPFIINFISGLYHKRISYVCIDITPSYFYPYIPDINTFQGLIIIFSTLGFFWAFKKKHLFLKIHFLVIYTLYLINLLSIAFLKRSFLIMPRLWIWAEVLFYCVSIIFLKELVLHLYNKFDHEIVRKTLFSMAIIFLVLSLKNFLSSSLYRNNQVLKMEKKIHQDMLPAKIFSKFKKREPLIISDQMHLAIHCPFFYFLPPNLIYANPFSDLEGRERYLRKLESLEGWSLYQAMNFSPYGRIDGIVGKTESGKISCSILNGMMISIQPPIVFEFLVARFHDKYFNSEKIGNFMVITLKDTAGTVNREL